MAKKDFSFSVKMSVKQSDVEDLLDSAANGSRYWADSSILGFESTIKRLMKGNDVKITDFEEDKTQILTLKKVKDGLAIMAEKQPKDFADFLEGNYDMYTGDTFLQCCLFGEVIYS